MTQNQPLPAKMTSVAQIRNYLFDCKNCAYFTIVSVKTGNRFTYRLRRRVTKTPMQENFFFADLLTGPENSEDYTWIGTAALVPQGWRYSASEKSSIPQDAKSQQALRFFVARINYAADLDPARLEFWHSGRCSRCGGLLTTPASLARGMGPKCWAKSTQGA